MPVLVFDELIQINNIYLILYQDTISLVLSRPDAVLDMGDLATLKKSPRNTHPVPWPENFGDVIHMDIVFRYIYWQCALWHLLIGTAV
jgi:hypothetical protein